MSTPVGIIKKLVDSLTKTTKTGTEAVDEALKNFGISGGYSAFLREFEGAKSDLSQQDFLEQKCGVRLNNKDTGAITGSDAGGKTTKTVDTIIPETAAAKELTDDEYNSFTKNGLTVNIQYVTNNSPGENFGYDGENYLAKQKLVVKNLYNWWLPEALDLINESLGINFTDGRASVNEIDIKFVNGGFYDSSGYSNLMRLDTSYDVGRVSALTLNIDASKLYTLADTDKNGDVNSYYANSLYSRFSNNYYQYTNYLDRLFLQAFTEMALDANLYYPEKLPSDIPMGLWQIVGGYDDSSTTDYAHFYYGLAYNYAVFRYFAKNYSDGTPDDELPEGLSYNSSRSILTASTAFTGTDIDLADFDPLVKTVDASALKTGVNITGNESANSLKGGSGADTLNGSTGNDTLTGGGGNDVFIYEAGNDVITDYASGDKISLGADISNSSVKGSDVVFIVGRNTLTVKDGADKTLNLIDSYGDSFTTIIGGGSSDELTLDNSSASPVTLDSGVKIADASSRTKAIKITGNTAANTIIGGTAADTLYGGAGNDSLYGGNGNDKLFGDAGNDTLNGGSGNDTLTGGNGNDVFIYEAGNDVITDYTTGDKISLGAAISKSSVKGSDVVFVVGRNTLTVKDGKGKTLKLIDSAGKSSTTIIGSSGGGSSDALTLDNSSASPVTLDSGVKIADASSRTKAIKITGNTAANTIIGGTAADTLYGGAGNDSLYGGNGNDKLFGDAGNDTLNGGSGNDTLTGGNGNDVFIYEAGNDVITDYTTGDKISLGAAISKSSVKGSDVVFTVGRNTLTIKDGKGKTLNLIDSYGDSFTTIIGGGSSDVLTLDNSSASPVTLDSDIKTADASLRTKAIKITGNTAANSIVGGTGADTIYGGSGNDKLFGGNGNDKLFGDAGADSLNGGSGNDTLTGGAGNDVFIYEAGNDVIADYTTGDKISLGAAISKSSVKGSDVVFVVGRNTLTVKDGADKTLRLVDSYGDIFTTIISGGSSDVLTLDNSSASPVTLDSDIKTADASLRTKAIKITGNTAANSIVGGTGADTIYGGSGNDSLWGNKGADTFLYFEGEGKDVIYGFENSDMLLITGAFSASYNSSKKELAFKVGSTANALTLKDFTATTFKINGFDYSISGSTLKRK